ncbi:MAG: hypothetical protein C0395_03810 [Gemmatimonas sp.]|nr:hypothetical protein [Gemmatimonas sp.]
MNSSGATPKVTVPANSVGSSFEIRSTTASCSSRSPPRVNRLPSRIAPPPSSAFMNSRCTRKVRCSSASNRGAGAGMGSTSGVGT